MGKTTFRMPRITYSAGRATIRFARENSPKVAAPKTRATKKLGAEVAT